MKSFQLSKQLLEMETLIAIAALSISVIAMSFSAIFIKFSEEAAVSPNATIFNRLWITTLTLAMWRGLRGLSSKCTDSYSEAETPFL